jgi:glutaredoxin 3
MIITIYSKDGCPYCEKVRTVVELAQFKYVEYKLNTDFSSKEFYSEFGEAATFPRVLVNADLIGGCVETIQYLKDKGCFVDKDCL